MEQSYIISSRQREEQTEFDLREWAAKARISRESTMSRRFSASNLRSFREDFGRSFRSNFTISSTASSPGYPLKDEIDPATYSFTTALKALQARNVYSWECLSPEGFALNSKWNEAEKYICNPLSGEVPLECLSSKTLNGRSFRNLASMRVTMSAPLVFSSSHSKRFQPKPSFNTLEDIVRSPIQDKIIVGMTTRDVGTQSTPPNVSSSSSPSPASTPSIKEISSLKRFQFENVEKSVQLLADSKSKETSESDEVGMKGTNEKEETERSHKEEKKKLEDKCWRCRQVGGCLSWRNLRMRRRPRDKTEIKSK